MTSEQLDRLCVEAMQRITYYINRCAAQHLRRMRETSEAHQMIAPIRDNQHLHRPNDRALKMKAARLVAIGTNVPGAGTALPGLVAERERMFAARLQQLKQRDLPIRNSTVTGDRPYKTGDGDCFHQAPRPGSMVAFGLPSKGIGT